ncbi:uncharacterized protein [Palaemon carinicauda]|uniref:uncharacterized protein n=1 Tax=Palaemon carinicauda TaxID=392227 RepID=UPI0035B57998
MADSIERELDTLFLGSVWAREYNHSQVVSLAKGSLLVRAQLLLNVADLQAATKMGSVFLRGLHNRHGNDWLGQYSIDVTSIRFTNVAVDPSSLSSTTQPPATEEVEEPSTPVVEVSNTTPLLNVGWGEWGPWSSCFPCSPQYDQIRTRQCHMDAGRGVIISTIEPCLPTGMGGQLEGSGGEMDSRTCQCPHINNKDVSRTTPTTTTTTNSPWKVEEQPQREEDRVVDVAAERLCDSCLPGEVCVGLEGEPYPTCRTALDSGDRTGCGGLCAIDSEVCQALGSRAFQCHSASLCLHDEWRCDDGLCIPHIKRCDGHMNCYDQSDEQRCHCGNNQFQCGNNTSCLPSTSKCDGKMDCWDGSDEVNCTTLCPNPDTQFTCRSSQCIPKQQFCDGLPDCRDGSDEPFGCAGRCQANEYQCRNRRCVPVTSVCDGRDSCGDFSDEQNCNRPLFTVAPGTGTPILNVSNSTTWSGIPVLNISTSAEHFTTARTDRIWLLHLGGKTTYKSENTTPKIPITTEKYSPTVSGRVSLDDFGSRSRVELESNTPRGDLGRGWKRTAQLMPSLDDYAKLVGSESKATSALVHLTDSESEGHVKDSKGVIKREVVSRSSVQSRTSNMEMQGNKRT